MIENNKHLDELSIALDNKDIEKVISFLTDDCLFQAGNNEPIQGKELIADTLNNFFDSVISTKHEVGDKFETENSVVHRGRVTYTRLDNSLLTIPFCDVFKMKGTKIAEYYIYINWSELFI